MRGVMLSFSFLIAFLLHLLLFATAPMASIMIGQMGLSHAEFGMVYSASMFSLILFRIPWGLIADRIGYLWTLKIALPIAAASALARAFAPSYPMLLASQFILGLGLASVMPCLPLIIKEWSAGRPLGLATGIYISGFAAGNAAALGVTPLLLEIIYWRYVLFFCGGLAVVMGILWWGWAKSSMKSTPDSKPGQFKTIFKNPLVWILLLLMSAAMGGYDTLATWMPKVLEMKKIDKSLASLLPLGFFLAGPVVGWISDRFPNRKNTIILLGLLAAASTLGINYAPFPVLLFCLFLSGFTTIGVLTITLALPAEQENFSSSIGTVVGLISSLGNVGPLVMPVVFGLLIDLTGSFHASVFFVAALSGITFILGGRVSTRNS
ncbi:MAG: MFS transporter [Deltaproteobacteria bacterium]|nr:MFS transporter [Deltaproteobacteria bacterium]